MRLNPIAYGALAVLLFAAPVAGAVATGAWQTTGGPGMGAGGGQGGSGVEGAGGGQGGGLVLPENPDVMDVRGRTSIGDVAAAWDIPLAEVLAAFDLPADTPAATQLRELESDTFSVSALREWLAALEGG